MSQAAALLSSLSSEDVATYVASTTEDRIVISDDRIIRIPDSLKRLAVQYDHDIETVTFDCPRYWDKHDMSQMIIYINYLLPNGTKDRYRAQNVTAVGQTMSFDWTISNNVTQYKGSISFLVCVVKTDDEGNEALHWNSELNQEAYVSEGLECKETALRKYPDIITHLLTRMEEVEAIATPEAMQTYTDTWLEENHARILAEIEAKGAATLATIPEDYTETNSMAKESVRTKGDAIVCSVRGEVISVSDSSDDHIRNLRVFGKTTQVTTTGKNLFDVTTALSNQKRGTTTVSDYTAYRNGVRVTSNSYDHGRAYMHLQLEPGEYTISAVVETSDSWNFSVKNYDTNTELIGNTSKVVGRISHTFTLDAAALVGFCFMSVVASGPATTAVDIQLELGSEATPYEPYSGGFVSPSPDWLQPLNSVESPTIDVYSKNLLKLVASNQTINGVTFTINDDQSVTIKGAATDTVYYGLNYNVLTLIPGEQYTMTGGLAGSSGTTYRLYAQTIDGKKFYADYGNGVSFTATDEQWQVLFAVYKDATVDFTIYPMLRLKSVTDATYESYTDQSNVALPYSLPAIPVSEDGNYIDANGQQWVCDEIDFERGVYIQRVYKLLSTYTTNWMLSGSSTANHNAFYRIDTDIPRMVKGTNSPVLSSHFSSLEDERADTVHVVGGLGNQEVYYFVPKTDFPDVETWTNYVAEQAAAGTPITTYHVLVEPIETPLTAEELEAFKALKTNYPHTTVLNDAGAHMELSYNADTKTYVDNGIKQTVTDVLEAIENGSY